MKFLSGLLDGKGEMSRLPFLAVFIPGLIGCIAAANESLFAGLQEQGWPTDGMRFGLFVILFWMLHASMAKRLGAAGWSRGIAFLPLLLAAPVTYVVFLWASANKQFVSSFIFGHHENQFLNFDDIGFTVDFVILLLVGFLLFLVVLPPRSQPNSLPESSKP